MRIDMNKIITALFLVASFGLSACPGEKTVGGKIDDALDSRPNEKIKDKAEDIGDAIKDERGGRAATAKTPRWATLLRPELIDRLAFTPR